MPSFRLEDLLRGRDVLRNPLVSRKDQTYTLEFFVFYIHFHFHVAIHVMQDGAMLCFQGCVAERGKNEMHRIALSMLAAKEGAGKEEINKTNLVTRGKGRIIK